MKKKISILLAIILIINAVCITVASAATIENSSNNLGSSFFAVKYNGEAVVFPDAQPFVDKNSRTLVPVRFVAETMGADVDWSQEAQAAVIKQNGLTITVPIGSDTISVTQDGSTDNVKMDTAAVISEERTYVPIRFVAEALGAWVGYSDLFNTVQIYKDKLTPAEIDRLHSYYDMTHEEYCKATGQTSTISEAMWEKIYPQLSSFTGTYGFGNANEYRLRNPNGATGAYVGSASYKGKLSGDTYSYGSQPDIDFTKLVLDEACGAASDLNSEGKASISLRSDLSCVYWSRHSSTAATCVRGVLTVTIPEDADLSYIQKNYDFISNPKSGETRNIDVEITVNTFSTNVYWSSLVALV
jgi:hypothetical protein